MPNSIEGSFATPPGRFALVAGRFNEAIVEGLVNGAIDGLKRHGVADDAIDAAPAGRLQDLFLVARFAVVKGLMCPLAFDEIDALLRPRCAEHSQAHGARHLNCGTADSAACATARPRRLAVALQTPLTNRGSTTHGARRARLRRSHKLASRR